MELEEDLNLKMLDDVKNEYLQTFQIFKKGYPKWNYMTTSVDKITFLFKFICIEDYPIIINYHTGGERLVFSGEQLCGKQKLRLSIIGKTQQIQGKMKEMLQLQNQYYILHKLQIFYKQNADDEKNNGNNQNKGFQERNIENYYYVLDEESQILEDESMDFTSCLTSLAESNGVGENVFESNYGRRAIDKTQLKLLNPKLLSSFEGVIVSIIEGSNVLQVDELIYGLCLNSKIDRFYRLKLMSGENYIDSLDVYLLYDVNDKEAVAQLKFYLVPYQRVLLSRCLSHFDAKMEMFAIAYFRSSNFSASIVNLEMFHMSPRGIEFFSRHDREENRVRCETERINRLEGIKEVYNLQRLIEQEGCLIRRHLRTIVRVKKIKYWKARLLCAACKSEWTNGLKHCFRCKQTLQYDQEYLDSHAYLYLTDELAVSFFSITENEKTMLQRYLQQNDSYLQMYYSLRQQYPLEVVKFKDRIFTRDLIREIIAIPFADLMNKILTNTQIIFRDKILSNECHPKHLSDNELSESNLTDHMTKKISKKLIFINGTYIHSPFAPTKLSLHPIPCLKLVHIFPSTPTIQKSLSISNQIQLLQAELLSYQ